MRNARAAWVLIFVFIATVFIVAQEGPPFISVFMRTLLGSADATAAKTLLQVTAPASSNVSASGSTNATLAGVFSVNGLILTNGGTFGTLLLGPNTSPVLADQAEASSGFGWTFGDPTMTKAGIAAFQANLTHVTSYGAYQSGSPNGTISADWRFGPEFVDGGVTNVLIQVGSQKYKVLAVPLP